MSIHLHLIIRPLILLLVVVALDADEAGFRPADWPQYLGPHRNGAVGSEGLGLVKSLKQAHLLWISEERNLGTGWGPGHGPLSRGRKPMRSSGYGMPVVAHGRVYLQWFVPTGTANMFAEASAVAKLKDPRHESYRIDAEDVVLCADAATGRTLWQARLPGGINWNWYHGHCFTSPTVTRDLVYLQGSGGLVHALQVADGKVAWTARTGPGSDAWDAVRAAAKAASAPPVPRQAFNVSPLYLPPGPGLDRALVVVNDQGGTSGKVGTRVNNLVALDAATGELRWRVDEVCGHINSPTAWRHGGGTVVIAVEGDGATARAIGEGTQWVCGIDAATGAERWRLEGIFNGRGTSPIVVGDVLVVARAQVRGRWDRHWKGFLRDGRVPSVPLPPAGKAPAPRPVGLPGLKQAELLSDLVTRSGGTGAERPLTKEEWSQVAPGWSAFRLRTDAPPEELWTLPLDYAPGYATAASDGTRVFLQSKPGLLAVDLASGRIEGIGPKICVYAPLVLCGDLLVQGTKAIAVSDPACPAKAGAIGDGDFAYHPYLYSCVAGGRLYIRGWVRDEAKRVGNLPENGALFCFDLQAPR